VTRGNEIFSLQDYRATTSKIKAEIKKQKEAAHKSALPVINLLETYFGILPNMIAGLRDNLKDTKEGYLSSMDTKLYKLKALKTKLHNCLAHSFGDHIDESMPIDISKNNERIYFLLIISRTFPGKDAHKEIIKKYILELKITKSNSMESYQ
jgi:hypothetical protein